MLVVLMQPFSRIDVFTNEGNIVASWSLTRVSETLVNMVKARPVFKISSRRSAQSLKVDASKLSILDHTLGYKESL